MKKPESFPDLIGYDLGIATVSYSDRDAILYALACGARSTDLDLVYERQLRVLPGFATALGLWAVERCGDLGVYDRTRSLHVSQSLVVHQALPAKGNFHMTGRVANVWDKGKATIVDIEATCPVFTAGYSIFLPGIGGWGGENQPRGPQPAAETWGPAGSFQTIEAQAALYRLTGDRHPIHIDPQLAASSGFARPILHGLCTLGIALRELSSFAAAHPADLKSMSVRLSAPVLPGDCIEFLAAKSAEGAVRFDARVGEKAVLSQGVVSFGP